MLALACAQLAFFTSSSLAAPEPTRTYLPQGFAAANQGAPDIYQPSQIAAEPGTGNLLIANTGNGNVLVLSTEPDGALTHLGNLGEGIVVTPVGIAVDQGTGAIYVSDSGAGQVFRFTSDGASTPTYALDGSFVSPTLASYASRLAVDPTTHDLLVADTGNQEVRRFDVSDGHQISAFNGSTSEGGQFTSLRSIAVATSGRIYVVDELFPDASELEADGARAMQFDASGGALAPLQGTEQEAAVATDPSSDLAVIATRNSAEVTLRFGTRGLAAFEGGASPLFSADFPGSTTGGVASLAIVGTGPHRLYALTDFSIPYFSGSPGIQTFKPAEVPAAEVGPIGAIGETTAQLTGAVAPGVLSGLGTAHFEYSLDGTTWSSTVDQTGIAGPGATAVAADLTGLRPNTAYSVRIHVANDDYAAVSPVATFNTPAMPPEVEASPVSDRTATSAVLNAKVNPFGQQTTYHFEYGETAAYGKRVPVGVEDVAGNGFSFRAASHAISGLQASTTYHYRLVATNATGTSATPDATFTTRSATDLTRAYEQVTPVDKRGLVVSSSGFYRAEPMGNGILYQTKHAYDAPDTAGASNEARYAAVRSPSGWELRQLDLPQGVSGDPVSPVFGPVDAISADFSHVLVGSDLKLAPGGVGGSGNLYRRDVETGGLEIVATGLDVAEVKSQAHTWVFVGGSADFSRIVFQSTAQPMAEHPTTGFSRLYEWTAEEGLRLISTYPDGSPIEGVAAVTLNLLWPAAQSASEDASRVYFSALASSVPGLYLRESGATRLVDGGQTTLLDVSTDGQFAAYEKEGNFYRYSRETDTHTLIRSTLYSNSPFGFLGMSDNGSSFFFGYGGAALTVWHEGTTTAIASDQGILGFNTKGMAVSPNGRYFTFVSAELASDYDNLNPQQCGPGTSTGNTNNRCFEAYVYDVQEQALTCVSCPLDGGPPAGHAGMGAGSAEFARYGPPFVNDKGQAFFDTPTALVAADTNGRRDVYEYQDGEVRLISPGTGDYNAFLADISASGDDVFLLTAEGLVGQDQDSRPDIYDARIGGGISSQSPSRAPGCSGGDCRALSAAPAAAVATTSESVFGQLQVRHKKARHHKKAHRKKGQHRKKARQGHRKGRSNAATKPNRIIGK